jgi:hypothetical protein
MATAATPSAQTDADPADLVRTDEPLRGVGASESDVLSSGPRTSARPLPIAGSRRGRTQAASVGNAIIKASSPLTGLAPCDEFSGERSRNAAKMAGFTPQTRNSRRTVDS